MAVNPELKRQLLALTNEEFSALTKKIGGRMGLGAIGGITGAAEAMGAEQRRLLPTQLSILEGRNIAVEPIPEETGSSMDEFLQKKLIENQLEKERLQELLGEGSYKVKGATVGGVNIEREPTEEEAATDIERKAKEKAITETTAQQMKKSQESMTNFNIAKNKLKTTAGAFKAMIEAEGAGRVGGFKRIATGATGKNPYVKAFEGQLVEAAAALAKLAAPSARVGQEIIVQFRKTLPTKYSTYEEFINQIRFSLHNAFSTALANEGKEYTQDVRDEVDGMVEEIVNVPSMSLGTLKNIDIPHAGGTKIGRFSVEVE